jgi:hypothetical protein
MKKRTWGIILAIMVVLGVIIYHPQYLLVFKNEEAVLDDSVEKAGTLDTTRWKTYTNTKYGYEIKYPENLTSDTEYGGDNASRADSIIIYDQENASSFSFSIDIRSQPLRELFNIYDDPYELIEDYATGETAYSKTKLAGYDAVKINVPDQYQSPTGYLLIRNGFVYFIMWPSVFPEGEKIAHTIKFND